MKKKLLSLLAALALCAGLAAPAAAAGTTFSDVPAAHWAHDAVDYVTDLGLFSGTGGNTFSPDIPMTRAMLIQVLFRYAGSPQMPPNGVFPFKDVPDDAYYWDAAFWGRHRNILADPYVENCDTLNPDEAVNRAEFAEMLWKFAREEFGYEAVNSGTIDSGPFTDMDEGDPGVSFHTRRSMLGWAYPNGILSGTSATTMSPDALVTRAQVATMLMRYDQVFHGGTASQPETQDYTLHLATPNATLEAGKSILADANTIPSSAREGLTFTFTSSDSNVASVVKYSGTSFSCRITGVHPGTATITVRDSNGLTASLTVTVTGDPVQQVPETPTGAYAQVVEEVIDRTNDLRAQAGSAPLTANAALSAAAQQRAQELAQQRTPSSVRTDGTYWNSVLTQQGLDIFRMSVREFQGSWTSPDAAIFADFVRNSYGDTPTDSTYTLAGAGVAQGTDGLYYFSMIVADTLVQGNSGPQEVPAAIPASGTNGELRGEAVQLVNECRAEYGLPLLEQSDRLMEMAQIRAEECAQMGKIEHARPDGRSWSSILEEYGLDLFSTQYGENLAWSTRLDAATPVYSWKGSPGHYTTMMAPNKTLIGIGAAQGSDGSYYYCLIVTDRDR